MNESSKISLKEEQREIINLNKLKAREKLKEFRQTNTPEQNTCVQVNQPTPETKSSLTCHSLNIMSGQLCGSPILDECFLESFGEQVCPDCKSFNLNGDYDLINTSVVKSEYLIQDNVIRFSMKCIERKNPLKPNWTPMKLYLRKHAKEKAVQRFGSLEALEAEKSRRSLLNFQIESELAQELLRGVGGGAGAGSEQEMRRKIRTRIMREEATRKQEEGEEEEEEEEEEDGENVEAEEGREGKEKRKGVSSGKEKEERGKGRGDKKKQRRSTVRGRGTDEYLLKAIALIRGEGEGEGGGEGGGGEG